jgi:hypothetical protein
MNKKEVKQIKSIASRLPVVYEQTVSGFYEDYDENGEIKLFPNFVNHEINHVRRMRKAYEKLGMDGIRTYLDMIHKIQIKRNDIYNEKRIRSEGEQVVSNNEDTGDRPMADRVDNKHTGENQEKKSTGRKKRVRDDRDGNNGVDEGVKSV